MSYVCTDALCVPSSCGITFFPFSPSMSSGFIGKMFKSRDLSMFALMFVIFRHDKPVDCILGEIGRLKYCRADIEAKECRRVLNNNWLFFRPSLFQHIGTHSSLRGKVQKLKDRQFGHIALFTPHFDNPPALVNGTIKQYQSYSISKAYTGETFFWGFSPVAGDALYFNFTPPLLISRFLFRSGNNEHPQDKFPLSTIIDVLPESPESDFTSTATSTNSPHSSSDADASPSSSSTWLFNSHSHPSNTSSSASSASIDRPFISLSRSQERGVTGHPSPLSPSIVSADSSHPKLTSRVKTTDGFVQITRFKSNGIAEALIGEEVGKIKCLRIRCPVASEKWVILSEVTFSLLDFFPSLFFFISCLSSCHLLFFFIFVSSSLERHACTSLLSLLSLDICYFNLNQSLLRSSRNREKESLLHEKDKNSLASTASFSHFHFCISCIDTYFYLVFLACRHFTFLHSNFSSSSFSSSSSSHRFGSKRPEAARFL